jgi:hypothetical protein
MDVLESRCVHRRRAPEANIVSPSLLGLPRVEVSSKRFHDKYSSTAPHGWVIQVNRRLAERQGFARTSSRAFWRDGIPVQPSPDFEWHAPSCGLETLAYRMRIRHSRLNDRLSGKTLPLAQMVIRGQTRHLTQESSVAMPSSCSLPVVLGSRTHPSPSIL